MLENSVVDSHIASMDSKALLSRRQVAQLVDCSLGNLLDAQRTHKLMGTMTVVNNVSQFMFSKAQLQAWRANSGRSSAFARITITCEDQGQLDKAAAALKAAGIGYTLSVQKPDAK